MGAYSKLIWEYIIANIPLIEPNGAMPVNIQDQSSPSLLLPMVHEIGATYITSATAINDYSFSVNDTTGMVVGQHVRLINALADRYYFGTILAINGSVISVDNPIDYVYISGSEVTFSTTNMAVDGSSTPVIYTLRTGAPSIPSKVDITRMIFVCLATSAIDLSKFGDLTALTKGLLLRKNNSDQHNIFNIKTNGDLLNIAFDFQPFVSTNPVQGVDGFASRLTFGGQGELGVVLRIEQDGNLEMWVQDNLTGLTSLVVFLEGHVVFGDNLS